MTEGVFLYYLPGKRFEELQVSDIAVNPFLSAPFFDLIHSPRLFREKKMGVSVLNQGPDGGHGAIIAVQPQADIEQVPNYDANRQKWSKYGNQWIGYQADMKPGPETLRRPVRHDGYEIELGDGKIWTAPVLQAFQESSQQWASKIPMAWGMREDGSPNLEPMEKYRELWNVSGQIFMAVYAGASGKKIDWFEWAVKCLGMNYRVGAVEAAILGLLDDENIERILDCAVDVPLVQAFEKKGKMAENPM